MQKIERRTFSSPKTTEIGACHKLHGNAAVHTASGLVKGCSCSIQRRFSPRLHKNCPSTVTILSHKTIFPPKFLKSPQRCPLVSSAEPTIEGIKHLLKPSSPKIFADSKTQNSDIPIRNPNFQRRLSPRLHRFPKDVYENSAITVDSARNAELPPSAETAAHQISEEEFKMFVLQRRVSPRLDSNGENVKQIPISNARRASEKRPYCGLHATNSFINAKRSKDDYSKDTDCENKHSNGTGPDANDELPGEITIRSKESEKKSWMDGVAPVIARGRIDARVNKTLQIFNTYYSQFLQERRMKSEFEKEKNSRVVKSKVKEIKQISTPPDLKAVYKMKEKNEILYPDKSIGHLPGIEVGYQFFSRSEMVAVGFHSHWLNGIDYIGSASKMEHRYFTFPIAISIIMSGQYEDDLDYSEDIIYTGEGGHDLVGRKLQYADLVLIRGNLALKNSMEQSVPIRVIRGHRSASSCSEKMYTYDGLYKVVEIWADKGWRGHHVYKYRFKRIEGQRKLTTNQVQFVHGCPSKNSPVLPGLVCFDISNGQEAIHIPVTNIFDDATVDEGFTYIKTMEVAESVKLPPTTGGCACKGNCTNCKICSCVKLNGSDFPYVRCDGGRLVVAKDVIFECGPNCSCGPRCLNRTSQRDIKYHLEVYRTPDKGWAVRSWDFIPSGAPVCEFVGLLRRSKEVDNMSGNDFIFEIDCWHTMNGIEGRERRFGNVAMSAINVLPNINENTLDITPEFCIDAGSRGNVSRFMNHSCEPNLFVQCVLSAHHDLRLARLVFFAAENIPPLQELTYDYGYALNSVVGPDGEVKALPCFCGSADCRKRLY